MADSGTAIEQSRKSRSERSARPERFRVVARDTAMIARIEESRYCTAIQLAKEFFPLPAQVERVHSVVPNSNCLRRLRLLYDHGYIDKLPDRSRSQPDVYCITSRAKRGVRL